MKIISTMTKTNNFFVPHRIAILIFFCLPPSFIYTFFSNRWRQINRLKNLTKNHEASVLLVQNDCKLWQKIPLDIRKPLTTNRKNWKSLSTRFYDKKSSWQVRTNHLTNILSVDYDNLIVRTEPMVTVGQMIDYLSDLNHTLAVSLEIREATVGGLAMGVGMTTHSHKVGLFQESIIAYELVLPSGEFLRVTKEEHSELFFALPWSHGTLGFIVALELKIIPIKQFVRVTYTPCFSQDEYCQKIRELSIKENSADFLEATIFSKETAVIIQGWFDDGKTLNSPPINRINHFYKPWYFEHVKTFLKKESGSELIYFKDYIFRHNRAIFWTLKDMLPMGNHPFLRFLIGWMYPPNIAFLKLSTPKSLRKIAISKQIYQDIVLPMTALRDAINLSHEIFSIYPLLVYPCRIYDHGNSNGQLRPPRETDRVPGTNFGMYCDLGIYGIPKYILENKKYSVITNMRKMEKFICDNNGYSFLYADTFMTATEFSKMFDLSLYEKVRERYHLQSAFPHLYTKTRSEIDIMSLE